MKFSTFPGPYPIAALPEVDHVEVTVEHSTCTYRNRYSRTRYCAGMHLFFSKGANFGLVVDLSSMHHGATTHLQIFVVKHGHYAHVSVQSPQRCEPRVGGKTDIKRCDVYLFEDYSFDHVIF